LKKSPTFKDSSNNISRKTKGELIEKKIMEFEDNIAKIEEILRKLEKSIDEKPSMQLIDLVRDDKVSKKDIYSYIPDNEAIKKNIHLVVQQNMA
jgi:hypothetical protein